MVKHYTFVDLRRINTYIEQITSLTTYDKVPVWKAEFSVTGPKVGVSQERHARDLSTHEKIKLLLEYANREELLRVGRMSSDKDYHQKTNQVFRLEKCNLVSVSIPQNPQANPPFRGLTMWFSECGDRPRTSHPLLLLKDFAGDDDDVYGHMSAFSTLVALMRAGFDLIRSFGDANVGPIADLADQESTLRLTWAQNLRVGETLSLRDAHEEEYNHAWERWNPGEVEKEFSNDPLRTLIWLGARVGATKEVEVLYRVRSFHVDAPSDDSPKKVVTIGCPLYIADQMR
jgi:hypothetical protein